MPYWLPNTALANPYVEGDEAISWSGMVKSHAEQYLWVAERRDAVIIARPVNQDSTRLIEMDAATKGMDIKGKSSSWGPHKGYIPREQRFSKLARVYRDDPDTMKKKVDKFNRQTEEMLLNATYPMDAEPEEYRGRLFAKERVLEIELPEAYGSDTKKMYTVVYDPNLALDPEQAVFLRDASGTYYQWQNALDSQSDPPQEIFHLDYPPIPLAQQPSEEECVRMNVYTAFLVVNFSMIESDNVASIFI